MATISFKNTSLALKFSVIRDYARVVTFNTQFAAVTVTHIRDYVR